jgi:CubicO group peptidase (beta-lactamase class C family)
MKNAVKFVAIAMASLVVSLNATAQNNPTQDGVPHAPDGWLFEAVGRPWWYKTTVSPKPTELLRREPIVAELPVVEQVKRLMTTKPARAFVLLDGNTIVHQQFIAPANDDAVMFGMSMGKTVTAMAVGQAICASKLKRSTKAADLLPELALKALGNATVHDLLRMASGTTESNADSTSWTPEQASAWAQGNLNLIDMVVDDRLSKAQRGVFTEFKPGETFSYKSTDPLTLSFMTAKATGMPWNQWVQQSVLNAMGAARTGLYVQDKAQNGLADSGMRLRLEDWIRFAVWVKRNSTEQGCFGDFVRDAMRTQIRNGSSSNPNTRRFAKVFGGYGYQIWTDSEIAPNTAWALGYGGQHIGWSTEASNHRMVIVFSNVETWDDDVHRVAREWMSLK